MDDWMHFFHISPVSLDIVKKPQLKFVQFEKINTTERFVLSPEHHLSRLFRDFISLNTWYITVKAKKNLMQIICFFSITNSFQYHPKALYSNMF